MDFKSYPSWNPFIKSIEGTPTVGSKIKANIVPPGNKGMVFTPTVLVNDTLREFRWLGNLGIPYLFDGEHTFVLIDHIDGTCTLQQYERFRGLLIPLFAGMIDKNSRQGFEEMNEALKKRAESDRMAGH